MRCKYFNDFFDDRKSEAINATLPEAAPAWLPMWSQQHSDPIAAFIVTVCVRTCWGCLVRVHRIQTVSVRGLARTSLDRLNRSRRLLATSRPHKTTSGTLSVESARRSAWLLPGQRGVFRLNAGQSKRLSGRFVRFA